MDSSIQVLKRGPYPEVAFCDMASVNGYEGDMESFISYMDVNSLQGRFGYCLSLQRNDYFKLIFGPYRRGPFFGWQKFQSRYCVPVRCERLHPLVG